MKRELSTDDEKFLDHFFGEELTEDKMKELNKRLENPIFNERYNQRLDQKYDKPGSKLLLAYMPMIIMMTLIVLGIYLWINSN